MPENAETYHDLFEAKHLSQYFNDYLDQHVYDGRGLRERFIFNCWVENVAKDPDGKWRATTNHKDKQVIFRAHKAIIATGTFTQPYVPSLPGQDSFNGPIIHQKEFGRSRIFTAEESDLESHVKVTVLGGSKSAADIAYAAAKDKNQPREVTWIIRTTGTGAIIMSSPKGFGKYRSLAELGSTRAMAAMSSANPYVEDSWWSSFLHRTIIGEWLLNKIWSQPAVESDRLANFEGREGRLEGFEGLRSNASHRWRSAPMGIIQSEDFWDVIARRVRVVRGEVERLEEGRIVLEDGKTLESDILLCATGWSYGQPLFSDHEKLRLGLPLSLDSNADLLEADRGHWTDLEAEADRKVLRRWPYLAQTSRFKSKPPATTRYKLYNMIVPVEDNSIAFLGIPVLPNSYHTALATTLWAIAALDGIHQLPSKQEMERDVAYINRWNARRYPVTGWMGNAMDYEMVSYTDKLLDELGLSSHRNFKSWWQDLTDPVLASDYAGVVDEFRRKSFNERSKDD